MANSLWSYLEKINNINIFSCMQCMSCSNGCPFVDLMDHPPNIIIRYLQLNHQDKVLSSNTPWICVGCNTCSFVCPMSIDIPTIFDAIKEYEIKNKLKVPEPSISEFHKQVLNSIEKYGKTHKLEIIFNFKMKNLDLFSDVGIGVKMLLKRKIHLTPPSFNHIKEIKEIFNKNKYHD